jgi:hypothetical protein
VNKQKIEQEIVEQPRDIGRINIPNVMLWMMKNAYEQTTHQKSSQTIKTLRKKLQHARTRRSQTLHS